MKLETQEIKLTINDLISTSSKGAKTILKAAKATGKKSSSGKKGASSNGGKKGVARNALE